jgi:hypothetical protein
MLKFVGQWRSMGRIGAGQLLTTNARILVTQHIVAGNLGTGMSARFARIAYPGFHLTVNAPTPTCRGLRIELYHPNVEPNTITDHEKTSPSEAGTVVAPAVCMMGRSTHKMGC